MKPSSNLALFPLTFAFATLDWVVLGVYAAILLGIGFYFYRPQGGTNEEFFVGNRQTHPLLAGISLFTALWKTRERSALALSGYTVAGLLPLVAGFSWLLHTVR